jgi:acyl-CoA synthetase (AMP-forming)/AMP-acid ligase II
MSTLTRREKRTPGSDDARTVAGLLDARVRGGADRVAFVDGSTGDAATWREIAALVPSWQAAFDGDRPIAIAVASPVTFCMHYLAALAAGVPVAPLDPNATPTERLKIADRLQVADVVTDASGLSPLLEGLGALRSWRAMPTGFMPFSGGPRRAGAPLSAPAAVVLATSGTTGTPKAVPLAEAQLLHVARAVARHHELAPSDRGYCPLPLFHVNAQVVGICSTLVSGGSLVVDDRFHRSGFWSTVERYDVTWLNLVPAMIALLADSVPSPGVSANVRFARSASAPLSAPVLRRFEESTGIGVLETYGMTEAASQIAANPLESASRRAGSVGRPVATSLRVVDAERRPLPAGEVGLIEIAGEGVVASYLDAALVAMDARAPDGWLVTGDLGSIDADGFVRLAGRADEVINRGGEKVYPREVEDVLLADGRVVASAVVGRPHAILGAEPVAFVVPSTGAEAAQLTTALHKACEHSLSRFKRPVEIHVVESLPAGPTGKISRKRVASELLLGTEEGEGARGNHNSKEGRSDE